MIEKVELRNGYSVEVENDIEKQKSRLGVENWQLMFNTKQEVVDHMSLLGEALKYWEYD